jgi:hypothetical protein
VDGLLKSRTGPIKIVHNDKSTIQRNSIIARPVFTSCENQQVTGHEQSGCRAERDVKIRTQALKLQLLA